MKITKKEATRIAKAIERAGGRRAEAAAALGMTPDALRRRLGAVQAHGLVIYPAPQGNARTITDEQVADAAKKAKGNARLVAAELGIGVEAARNRLRDAYGSELDLIRERSAHAETRDQLRETQARVVQLEDRISKLDYVANASRSPATWTLKDRVAAKNEHIPLLFVSDAQIGEVIDPKETEYGRGYNTKIFRQRYRQLIDTTIYLSTEHVGDWTYPGIVYLRGGDTISGDIHDELQATNDMTPIQACEVAFEEESAGIYHLLEAFGRVEVKDVGGGNHDRGTKKPWSKQANARSYDRLIAAMLRREFKNEERVSFQVTESPDIFFPIYDKGVLATHGDKIGAGGGTGFIGPGATILKGAQKVAMEQQSLGRTVDLVMVGHFHTMLLTRHVIANGCFPGYSEFAKMFRFRPEPPSQLLTYWHKRHGLVDIRPIALD